MDQLGPSPSIEAVQDEREFYQILLDTLDPEAVDYAVEKASHERKIREMELYLATKQSQPPRQPLDPRTPLSQSATAFQPGANMNLPSRERHDSSNHTPHGLVSPSFYRAINNDRKRPRENSLRVSDAVAPSNKSRRTSASNSVSGSSTGTPRSVDSLDEASAAYEKEAARQRMLEHQRLQEERFRMQRLDAELARRLAQEHSYFPSPSAASTRPGSQSYFGNDGRIQRQHVTPSLSQPEGQPASPSQNRGSQSNISSSQSRQAEASRSSSSNTRHVPHTYSRPGLPLRPESYGHDTYGSGNSRRDASYNLNRPTTSLQSSSRSVPGDTNSQMAQRYPWMQPSATVSNSPAVTMHHQPSPRRNDRDVEFISPEQFREASVGRAQRSPSHNAGHAPNNRIPGSYPGSEYDPLAVYTRQPKKESDNGPSLLSHLPSHIRPRQSLNNSSQPGSLRTESDWISALFEIGHNITNRSNPISIESDSEEDDMYRSNMVYDRGLDYLYSDPTKTKEELDNLLKNIRPDEDLPPELRQDTPDAMSRPLMAHQKLGLTWLKQQEEGSNKGCILADDMGLGKTIQALALMLVRPSSDPAVRTTLIVAPVALMKQWKDEIDDKVKPGYKLRTFVYHGSVKATYAQLASYDVVITTLGKLGAEMKRSDDWEFRKRNNPSLVRQKKDELVLLGDRCKWYRVIVDEAQSIKNKATLGSMAACRLQAKHRLCMTGTPMMNNVGELYSLLHFLRIPPYNSFENFSRDIGRPIAKGGEYGRERGMKALQALLKAVLLRRTKQSTIKGDDGVERPILTLPERTTEIKHAVFDEEQKEFYDALEKKTAMKANRFLQKGHIGREYANILVLLLRLRQACDHPHLIKDLDRPQGIKLTDEEMTDLARELPESAIIMIKEAQGAFECPICMDATENPTFFFPCGHDVCSECFTKLTDPSQAIGAGMELLQARCPECRAVIDLNKILTYTFFKKIHLRSEYVDDMLDGSGRTASDTESDDSGDDESDADSQGDLRDFIVDDDETEDEDGDADLDDDEVKTEPGIKAEEVDDDSDASFHLNKKRQTKAATQFSFIGNGQAKDMAKAKSKGKGKGKWKPKKPKMTMAQLKKESRRNAKAKRKYLKRLEKDYESSAKIDKTMEILADIEATSPDEKTIIFSQFTSFLDLLEVPIARSRLGYKRYDGSMSAKEREVSIDEFKTNPRIKVMLISLKAGNAGLNLTRASQVIILDPFWNPFIEEQAIDRAHRIGQQRKVKVHRILCQETVEDRIVALQEKKRQLISEALDEKAAQSLSRLGVNELRYLFGLGGNPY